MTNSTDFEIISQMLKERLLSLDDRSFDDSMKPLVTKWSQPVKALELLEVLDHCIFSSLTSDFYISVMQLTLDMCLQREEMSLEELIRNASWRKQL